MKNNFAIRTQVTEQTALENTLANSFHTRKEGLGTHRIHLNGAHKQHGA